VEVLEVEVYQVVHQVIQEDQEEEDNLELQQEERVILRQLVRHKEMMVEDLQDWLQIMEQEQVVEQEV
jgi:hypothetical protein